MSESDNSRAIAERLVAIFGSIKGQDTSRACQILRRVYCGRCAMGQERIHHTTRPINQRHTRATTAINCASMAA